jgi:hypothetical protein
MASEHYRKDKTCLNCGSEIEHFYCGYCGQQNIEMHDSIWHLIRHYIEDFFHFDTRMGRSIVPLIFRPGFLAAEWLRGKRTYYINPISAIIFLSTVFFILFWKTETGRQFTLKHNKDDMGLSAPGVNLNFSVDQDKDSTSKKLAQTINEENDPKVKDSILMAEANKEIDLDSSAGLISKYAKKSIKEKAIAVMANKDGEREFFEERAKHHIPQLTIIMIPFFTFFMWLFYLRRRRLYVEHLIFVTYNYCFLYLLLLLWLLLSLMVEVPIIWVAIFVLIYLLAGMKNFYKLSWGKTIFKFVGLTVCFWFISIIALLINFLIALY